MRPDRCQMRWVAGCQMRRFKRPQNHFLRGIDAILHLDPVILPRCTRSQCTIRAAEISSLPNEPCFTALSRFSCCRCVPFAARKDRLITGTFTVPVSLSSSFRPGCGCLQSLIVVYHAVFFRRSAWPRRPRFFWPILPFEVWPIRDGRLPCRSSVALALAWTA